MNRRFFDSEAVTSLQNTQIFLDNMFHTVRLLLVLFVLACSITGMILIRRIETAQHENFFGLVKMLVFALVLSVCMIFHYIYRVLEYRFDGESYGFPFWCVKTGFVGLFLNKKKKKKKLLKTRFEFGIVHLLLDL